MEVSKKSDADSRLLSAQANNAKSSVADIPGIEAEAHKNVSIDTLEKINSEQKYNSTNKEGGEWNLLISKLKNWKKETFSNTKFKDYAQPIFFVSCSIILFISHQFLNIVLNAIAKIPLAPRLFELSGLVWILAFLTRFILNKDNDNQFSVKIKSKLNSHWKDS